MLFIVSDLLFQELLLKLVQSCFDTVQKSHFPPANHLPTTDADDLSAARVIIKQKGHQHQWLAGGYDLEIGLFKGG